VSNDEKIGSLGFVDLVKATALSVNTGYVKLGFELGLGKVIWKSFMAKVTRGLPAEPFPAPAFTGQVKKWESLLPGASVPAPVSPIAPTSSAKPSLPIASVSPTKQTKPTKSASPGPTVTCTPRNPGCPSLPPPRDGRPK
jgi:membrane peptidoglycan carboxypeptidase